jgi:hypothetical protein
MRALLPSGGRRALVAMRSAELSPTAPAVVERAMRISQSWMAACLSASRDRTALDVLLAPLSERRHRGVERMTEPGE